MLINQRSNETDTLYAVPMRKADFFEGTVYVFAASADEADAIVQRPEHAEAVEASVREPCSNDPAAIAPHASGAAQPVTEPRQVAEVMVTVGQDIRAMALEERLEDEVDSLRQMLLEDDDSFARELVRGYLEDLPTEELLETTQVAEDLEEKADEWLYEQDPEASA
ncbi:hypothetical protein [Thioalkalivibrio sp. ALE16]|uniref:hypothetical protein n=1 Tax=Thioalkalivibrio sp. ALE16 TaxID=1158172 RepID=UPI00037C9EDA|nr:hypothetical protein [Thioalkalivibrio sp. ALE16]